MSSITLTLPGTALQPRCDGVCCSHAHVCANHVDADDRADGASDARSDGGADNIATNAHAYCPADARGESPLFARFKGIPFRAMSSCIYVCFCSFV
jgi:hypothetical protein